jgi:hypothetical protein
LYKRRGEIEAMLAALQESEQILNDMPVRGSFAKSLET